MGVASDGWIFWALPAVGDDAIHVVTSLDRWVRLAGVRGHRSGALFTADLTTRHPITITTPARTLVDLFVRFTSRSTDDEIVGCLRAVFDHLEWHSATD